MKLFLALESWSAGALLFQLSPLRDNRVTPSLTVAMGVERKIWKLRECPVASTQDPNTFEGVIERLMALRGVQEHDERKKFLNPRLNDLTCPFLLPEMDLAVGRVFSAIDAGEEICIFGDYDVDGITSIAILRAVLEAYGNQARTFIPRRGDEGYGLSDAGIARCMAEGAKPDLLIAVDCGTPSIEEVDALTRDGVDVVILDHHEPAELGRPNCVAMVNPKSGDEFTYLCSAGVVFKLAHALLKQRPLENFDLRDYTDLVALATISDIVPLVDENRLLVRHGLSRLPQTAHKGLQALQKVAGLGDGARTSGDVGFRLGPRINAAGRMDRPEDALEVLLSESYDAAHAMAERLDDFNRERQQLEKRIRDEAMEMLKARPAFESEPVIVLGSRNWHPGVVGIVASRLMRQFHKPSFVIAIDDNGVGKGSGRSIEGLSLVEAIRSASKHLIGGGGHAMAAGLSVDEIKIDEFREAFGAFTLQATTEEQRTQKMIVDVEVPLDLLSLEFLTHYDLLQPFGSGNPQPIFLSKEVHLSEAPRRLKNNHLKLSLRQGYAERDAIFFGGGENPLPDPPWDIAFTIDRNVFRGRTSLQIIIQDVRSAAPIS